MSERDWNQNLGENPAELDAADALSPAKNRPAAGAARAQTTQGLDFAWQGGSAATDFLGLESDARAEEEFAADPLQAANLPPATLPADSWLHTMDGSAAGPLAGAGASASPSGSYPKDLFDTLETLGADPVAEDVQEEPVRASSTTSTRPTTMLRVALAAVVLALLGSGAWFWRQHKLSTPVAPGAVEVATKPATKSGTRPKPLDGQRPVAPPSTSTPSGNPGVDEAAPATTSDPITVDPVDSTPPTNDVVTLDTSTFPATDTGPVVVEVAPTITFPAANDPGPSVASNPANSAPTNTAPTKVRGAFSAPPPSDLPLPGALRRATEADFAGLWRETTIPTQAIEGDTRLRTLNVGRVRVLLIGGEYYEGTLYAVGQKRVWLDLDLGRISFEASTVREMTTIASASVTLASGKQKPEDLVGLPHVEVHLPGGTVTGRLVGREGNRVTLVTDKGLRTVLESDDVRPVTRQNTRVLGRVAVLDARADVKTDPKTGTKNP